MQQIFTDAAATKSDGIANKEDEQSYFELLWESVNSRYLKNITILMDERGPSTNVCSKEEKIHTLLMKTVTTPPHQMTNPLHGLLWFNLIPMKLEKGRIADAHKGVMRMQRVVNNSKSKKPQS